MQVSRYSIRKIVVMAAAIAGIGSFVVAALEYFIHTDAGNRSTPARNESVRDLNGVERALDRPLDKNEIAVQSGAGAIQISSGTNSPNVSNVSGDVNIVINKSDAGARSNSYSLSSSHVEAIYDNSIVKRKEKHKNDCVSISDIIKPLMYEGSLWQTGVMNSIDGLQYDGKWYGGFVACKNGNPISYVVNDAKTEPGKWGFYFSGEDNNLLSVGGAANVGRVFLAFIVSPEMGTQFPGNFEIDVGGDIGIQNVHMVAEDGLWDVFSDQDGLVSINDAICNAKKYPTVIGVVDRTALRGAVQRVFIVIAMSKDYSCRQLNHLVKKMGNAGDEEEFVNTEDVVGHFDAAWMLGAMDSVINRSRR